MIPEALLISGAKVAIDNLMEKFIVPKISLFTKTLSKHIDFARTPKSEYFKEYFFRTYKKYSIINTLVLKNEQKLLKDLYCPLTLCKADRTEGTPMLLKVEGLPEELLTTYSKILITDTAGMGKSTMAKRIFLDVIDKAFAIPMFIELRRLSKDRTILMEIKEQLNSINKDFDEDILLNFITSGDFFFILDGYDEICLSDRSEVTYDIQTFIEKAGNNIFILTSRPEDALAGFGDFQQFYINPLNKKEAYELLRKYDNQGNISQKLIEELRSGNYNEIEDFLKNPLLVSLLYAAYDYKQIIPLKKHIFYRQVYDAYFDSHDLSKGDSYIHDKRSGLDIDDFDRVLRYLSYECLQRHRIEFEKDHLLALVDEARNYCSNLSFSSSDFVNDLLTAVPLFCRDGILLKWVHKSLQEYFAAEFIYKDTKANQDKILKAISSSKNIGFYMNILDIYYDIDIWGFKENILRPICESFISYYEENLFESHDIDKRDIAERIGYTFERSIFLNVLSKGELNDPDLCNKMYKEIQLKYNKEISHMIAFSGGTYLIGMSDFPTRHLLSLIRKRLPELFSTSLRKEIPENLTPTSNSEIRCDTGINNADEFKKLNTLLAYVDNFTHLDYEKCKMELTKINDYSQVHCAVDPLINGI